MADPEMRRAEAADLDGLSLIWQETAETLSRLDIRYRVAPDGAAQWRAAFLKALDDPNRCCIVAVRRGTVIGYMIGAVQPNAPGLLPEQIGMVIEMAVDSHGRGGRIGTGMFDLLSAWFREQGIQNVELRVPYRNAIAQAFWRAIGATQLYDHMWLKLRD